jgi:hypothetical protein
MLREIEQRARNILSRAPIGDVDLHELATLALELVTKFDCGAPYRSANPATVPSTDDDLTAMASLERQLSECRAELLALRRELETLQKG